MPWMNLECSPIHTYIHTLSSNQSPSLDTLQILAFSRAPALVLTIFGKAMRSFRRLASKSASIRMVFDTV